MNDLNPGPVKAESELLAEAHAAVLEQSKRDASVKSVVHQMPTLIRRSI